MSTLMVISKTVFVSASDDDVIRRSLCYWRERGFRFDENELDSITGRRGSLWGNLTSFDMSKLRAGLTIAHSPYPASHNGSLAQVEFTMTVDTALQTITEWNESYWIREMDTAESWLLYSDKQENQWREFDKQCHHAAWRWALTFGRDGRKIPPSSTNNL